MASSPLPDARDRLRRSLVTPEGIDLGVTLADIGARIGALVIDLAILLGAMAALTFIAVSGVFGVGTQALEPVAILWLLGFFVLRNGYFIVMEMRPRAATFGKRLTGLRVVARDGGRLTGDAVIARNLMREIELFLPLNMLAASGATGGVDATLGWLGVIWTGVFLVFPWLNRDRLRIGDLLAGTWVIRTGRTRLVADLAAAPTAAFVFTPAQLAAYGAFELDTLDGVIRDGDATAKLTVAQAIIDKIGWPDTVHDIDGFLASYYAQLRAALERGLMMGRQRIDKIDVAITRDEGAGFSAAQLAVYGPAELALLGSVLRTGDEATRREVAQRIVDKIAWPEPVLDVDAFLRAYYAALRGAHESGALAIANRARRR